MLHRLLLTNPSHFSRSRPNLSVIPKRGSCLSISAHPVSPVIATTNFPSNNSEEDIDMLPQSPEHQRVELGVRLSFGIFGISALMPWNGKFKVYLF